jgi:hypothetical protein
VTDPRTDGRERPRRPCCSARGMEPGRRARPPAHVQRAIQIRGLSCPGTQGIRQNSGFGFPVCPGLTSFAPKATKKARAGGTTVSPVSLSLQQLTRATRGRPFTSTLARGAASPTRNVCIAIALPLLSSACFSHETREGGAFVRARAWG